VVDRDPFGAETVVSLCQIVYRKANLHTARYDTFALIQREMKKGTVVPRGRCVRSGYPAIVAAMVDVRHQWYAEQVAVECKEASRLLTSSTSRLGRLTVIEATSN
jgi:hypothetical protein